MELLPSSSRGAKLASNLSHTEMRPTSPTLDAAVDVDRATPQGGFVESGLDGNEAMNVDYVSVSLFLVVLLFIFHGADDSKFPPSDEGPPPAIQITSGVIRNTINSQSVGQLRLVQLLGRLNKALQNNTTCPICWIRKVPNDGCHHLFSTCPVSASTEHRISYGKIRGLQLPSGICWHCAMPQV